MAIEMTTSAGYTIYIPGDEDLDIPLYDCRARETDRNAFLEISEDSAEWNDNSSSGSGVPPNVWHGLVQRVPCLPTLTHQELKTLSEELGGLIAQVIDGLTREWNGNNYVGVLTDDAAAALEALEDLLDPGEQMPSYAVFSAEDWLEGTSTAELLSDIAAAGSVEAWADSIRESALVDGQLICDDIADAICERLACACEWCECDTFGAIEADEDRAICTDCEASCAGRDDAD